MPTQTQPRFASTRLADFPGNWRYAVAPPEEKDRFSIVIAELLAEELVYGMPATQEIQVIIDATAAYQIRTWLDTARKGLQDLLKADAFVANNDAAKLRKAKEQAKTAFAEAEQALAQAKVDYMVAETDLFHRTRELEQYESAEDLLAQANAVRKRAFDRAKELLQK